MGHTILSFVTGVPPDRLKSVTRKNVMSSLSGKPQTDGQGGWCHYWTRACIRRCCGRLGHRPCGPLAERADCPCRPACQWPVRASGGVPLISGWPQACGKDRDAHEVSTTQTNTHVQEPSEDVGLGSRDRLRESGAM